MLRAWVTLFCWLVVVPAFGIALLVLVLMGDMGWLWLPMLAGVLYGFGSRK